MKKIALVVLLLGWMTLQDVFADSEKGYIWRHFTTEDGLSQNTVMDILQDHKGYMWFSTWNGLSRFDGYTFKSYKVRPGDDVFLTSSRIDKIIEDKYGYLWLYAYGKNVVRFDPELEVFQNVPERTHGNIHMSDVKTFPTGVTWLLTEKDGAVRVSTDTASSRLDYGYFSLSSGRLKSNRVFDVILDSDNNEWLLTDNGLAVIEKESPEALSFFYGHNPEERKQSSFFCGTDNAEEIWFGSVKGRVWRYIKKGKRFIHLQAPVDADICAIHQLSPHSYLLTTRDKGVLVYDVDHEAFEHFRFDTSGQSSSEFLPQTYQANNGDVWIQWTKSLLVQYQKETSRIKEYLIGSINNDGSGEPEFMMHEDKQGLLWIHPLGGGVFYYDDESDELSRFFTKEASGQKFTDRLHSMFSDQQGNLWMGTRAKGLERFVFPKAYFGVKKIYPDPRLINDNDIRALFQDSGGLLWVSTKGGRLGIYGRDEQFLGFLGRDGRLHADARFSPANVYAVMEDKAGTIWIATKGEGLIMATPVRDAGDFHLHLKFFKHDPDDIYSLSHNDVYHMHEDVKGQIWIATYGGGINLLQKTAEGHIQFINHFNHLTRYPIGNCYRVRYITSCSSGRMWVGTTHGLVVFDSDFDQPEEIQFFNYTYRPSDAFCLSNNDVHGILETINKDVYVATFGGGLNKLISSTDALEYRFKSYTSEDGLQADALLSVLEDTEGFIWMLSENGVSRFDPDQKRFRNFNKTDFSQTLSFSEGAGLVSMDGSIRFGTNKGVMRFHPDSISKSAYVPPIVFTEFRLLNKRQRPSSDGVLKRHIDAADPIQLKHHQNIFSIGFAAMDMKNPESVSYAAKLEGFDSDWVFLDRQRMLNFANLPAGNYVLKVRSTNSDGVWMDNEKSVPIHISPSFWVTTWAYVLYFVLFFFIGWLAIYILFVIYRLRHQIVVDHQVLDMKLEFFTNISHELRTPLTLILAPLEQVLNDSSLSKNNREALEVVERNSSRMLRLINQLLDFVKINHRKLKMTVEQVHVPGFVTRVMDNFRLIALEQNVDLTLEDHSEEGYIWADVDKLEKVVFNLLSNAFKFIEGGAFVKVILDETPDSLVIKVMDDGVGINEAKKGHLFQRFENSIGKGVSKGPSTGIGLSIVKEMVGLHNGDITVESLGDRGTVFVLKFKKGLAHFDDEVRILEDETLPVVDTEEWEVMNESEHVEADAADNQLPVLLLVEDNSEVRRFIKSILEKDYGVLEAANGAHGFELAKKHLPDLIVSDLMMPVKSGMDLLNDIRADIETSHIPFIMLTAKADKESQLEGIGKGADDYIPKPFSPSYLQSRIINLLELRKNLQLHYQGKQETVSFEIKPSLPEVTSIDEKFLSDLKRLMEQNIENSSLVVDDLVNEMALSRSVFFKKLKALTGLAPIEYIREMRLQRAVQLIESSQYNMTQIAYMVGLNDPRYFSKCFKQRFGVTPSEYKHKQAKVLN
ncbi:hybrid sensor histidine kinase/response regulator transcription factor [Geofilum rubicundum]|uniref:histidine kinase n=1 Tax=Geofilum rubicundum JCM 15548 TaxID=1236989 RepID=A0A0E9M1E4_9BACT|nr:two-component regulator propeller domain-containing protein [Geofilum rubicundum]GAO31191.1 DNA-binding response regulator, AraC family [Geofilum rubicundum JCM 15548]